MIIIKKNEITGLVSVQSFEHQLHDDDEVKGTVVRKVLGRNKAILRSEIGYLAKCSRSLGLG